MPFTVIDCASSKAVMWCAVLCFFTLLCCVHESGASAVHPKNDWSGYSDRQTKIKRACRGNVNVTDICLHFYVFPYATTTKTRICCSNFSPFVCVWTLKAGDFPIAVSFILFFFAWKVNNQFFIFIADQKAKKKQQQHKQKKKSQSDFYVK